MELIQRKQINNGVVFDPTKISNDDWYSGLPGGNTQNPVTKLVPDAKSMQMDINPDKMGYDSMAKPTSGFKVDNVASIAQNVGNVINFGSQLTQGGQYGRSLEDLNAQAGQSNGSIGGINYSIQNEVNAADEMSRVKSENTANTIGAIGTGASTGASIGSSFGPIGTGIGAAAGAIIGGIGSLFGSSKRSAAARRAIRLQQFKAQANNSFNRSNALSTALQQDFLQENGNQEDQSLFQYKYGKQPVISASGKINATPNAFVSKGEWIVDTIGGNLQYVDHGPNDTAKAKIKDTDAVISNNIKNPYTGNSLAEDVPAYAAAGQLGQLLNIQGDMQKRNINKFKCGKMPKYKLGTPPEGSLLPEEDWNIGINVPYDPFIGMTREQMENDITKRLLFSDRASVRNGINENPKFKSTADIQNIANQIDQNALDRYNHNKKIKNTVAVDWLASEPETWWTKPLYRGLFDPHDQFEPKSIPYKQQPVNFYTPDSNWADAPVISMNLKSPKGVSVLSGAEKFDPNLRLPVDIRTAKGDKLARGAVIPDKTKPAKTTDPEQVGIHELNPWTITAPRALGMLNSAIGLYKNNRQAVPYKNNYMPNTMANRALNRLAGLHIKQQPIMNDINDLYKQILYGIYNSGGVSSSQKQLQAIAAGLGTQRNRANALSSIQQQDNQYKSALSSAEMQHGAQEASNIMSSRNTADDMYYRALAAKRQIGRTYETDLYNNYQKMFANWNNMRMQNDMLGLYQQKINNDKHRLTP